VSAGQRLSAANEETARRLYEAQSPLMRLRLDREVAYGSGLRAVERVARYRWKAEHAPDEFERTAARLSIPHDEADAAMWEAEVKRLDREIAEMEGTP
jgi:hypothetical protein